MAEPLLNGPFDPDAIGDCRLWARELLAKSREYLSAGDLHQASEEGWGAASWMAKAVAVAHGWEYESHDHFSVVLNNLLNNLNNGRALTSNNRLPGLRSIANELHGNHHKRESLLSAEAIRLDLDSIAELLEILDPLTEPAG